MSKIKSVTARQIIDCKCRPMVEVDVVTDDGFIGTASAPTGSSVGMYEAYVLRDNDPNEYDGQSVHKAVDNVKNILGPAIIGMDEYNEAVFAMAPRLKAVAKFGVVSSGVVKESSFTGLCLPRASTNTADR